ncbi:MAG: uroporphyrinogen decarboxylase family protein [Eubacteriales bacterium]|nr:uroporphyrinogen decarboxylase family protein [Eubacteriales bacterium]
MTRIERIRTVMAGGVPDRVPVMTHNFLMAAREAGVTMAEYRSSSDVIASTLIAAQQKYDTDGILLDVDTALLASACGADVVYPNDIAAVTRDFQPRPIQQIIQDLANVDLTKSDRICIYLESINKMAQWCNANDVFLRANADQGPFSLGCLLVGMNEFLMTLLDEDEEENLLALMEQTSRIALDMHRLCRQAGGHCTSYGNSSEGCSVVSPAVFRKFAKPFEIRLNRQLKAEGIPTICHICGWTDPILPDLAETGIPMFEFDARTDPRKVQQIGSGHFVMSGNLDPAMLNSGKPEEVTAAARELLELFRGKGGLMIGPGCALGPDTPSENIFALVKATKQFG